MSIWRVVLVVGVMTLVGFVGGVWFVSSEWGIRLIRLPTVPSAAHDGQGPGEPEDRGLGRSRPIPQNRAVGVPPHWNFSGGSGGLGRLADRGDLLPSPGCSWIVQPHEFQIDQQWHTSDRARILIGVPSLVPKTGQFRYHLTQLTRSGQTALPLRLVLFDAVGNRYPARKSGVGTSSNLSEVVEYDRYDWDESPPLDHPETLFFGVERVIPDAEKLAGEAARAEAQKLGVEILPPPRIGEAFRFDLATADGQRIRSDDLKEKAVLILFSGPFPSGPSPMENIRAEFAPADLAIVHISFAEDAEEANRPFARLGEKIPLVLVPNDPKVRRLWREGAEITYLPDHYLLDHAGILRFREPWSNLADRLATTLGRPTHRGKFEAFVAENKARFEAQKRTNQLPQAPVAPPVSPGQH